MLIVLNSSPVTLQILLQTLAGAEKLDVISVNARVYHVVAGAEIELLPSTPLVRVGGTSVWRYEWTTPGLAAGMYTAEYTATDADGASGTFTENLYVRDMATELAAVLSDTGDLLDGLLGRYKVDKLTNTAQHYRRSGTPWQEFDLRDADGSPSIIDICERVPK